MTTFGACYLFFVLIVVSGFSTRYFMFVIGRLPSALTDKENELDKASEACDSELDDRLQIKRIYRVYFILANLHVWVNAVLVLFPVSQGSFLIFDP